MSNKKPEPLIKAQPQRKCPVCGHASYSAEGIHPQCNSDAADKQRRAVRSAEALAQPPSEEDQVAKRNRFNHSCQPNP